MGEHEETSSVDLTVVVVNYNNLRVLRGCLPALREALRGIAAETILSDNGSTDGSLEWVRAEFPEVHILENRANLGFAEANNRAFAIARGGYVFLLNPDTVIEPDAICILIKVLDERPEVGAVGPKLLNGDGSRQISARAFPTALSYAFGLSGLAWRHPKSRFYNRFDMLWWDGEDERAVDWVSGAAILTRREVLERVGGLDPYFFLTYDEVDWCHRVRKAGHAVWYTPHARIMHLDRQSEPQSNPNPEARIKYLTVERNSRVRYFVKHRGMLYAAWVECIHIVLALLVLIKARLLGTNQAPIAILEKELLLRLYWRTLKRLPRAIWSRLCRTGKNASDRTPYRVFINPYLADGG
ncbi:MAG: glycosyltransferase family 2 protein [Phycisphaerae bacterium]|nr:glycosyltransferase family 2 protein [Phycisphaerae bacterium]